MARSYRVIDADGHVLEPVEGSLSVLADYIGPEKILWAIDYPHPDGFFPGAQTSLPSARNCRRRPSGRF